MLCGTWFEHFIPNDTKYLDYENNEIFGIGSHLGCYTHSVQSDIRLSSAKAARKDGQKNRAKDGSSHSCKTKSRSGKRFYFGKKVMDRKMNKMMPKPKPPGK